MNTPLPSIAQEPNRSGRWLSAWNQFWFAPTDPTTLGLMRLLTGLVTFYTFFAYSLDLQALLGPHAWHDLRTRLEMVREGPNPRSAFNWDNTYEAAPRPSDPVPAAFYDEYVKVFQMPPPPPNPRTADEAKALISYRERWGQDARLSTVQGQAVWSVWFHITEPAEMAIAQGIILVICFLFVIGCCTPLTGVLTWLAALSYIHRAASSLFGVDTIMVILLLYLAIAPSGAALSVDRLIGRWWSKAGPGIIRRWRRWLGKPAGEVVVAPAPVEPVPSVAATVATRLLQIHLCVIYLAAGLAKLQGPRWWTGHAVWSTVANFEFAPMQQQWYLELLRLLGGNRVVFEVFFTFAALFTLTFEISYAFLIWRPAWRPVLLGMAFLLHGFIGMFMGLRTFSMLMVVMNLAFISPVAVQRLWNRRKASKAERPKSLESGEPALASASSRHIATGRIKRKA